MEVTRQMQSLLANFSILLFMHLCIQSVYYLAFQKRWPSQVVAVAHIFIVAIGIIFLYMLPVSLDGYLYDLRTIPMVILILYHGYQYGIPVLIIITLARFAFPGDFIYLEIFFTLLIPTVVTMLVRQKLFRNLTYLKLFFLFCWHLVYFRCDRWLYHFRRHHALFLFNTVYLLSAICPNYVFLYSNEH
ncbi:LytS/YhcK type 5TM receptor domain-containing protein [Pseudalkalibacillus sp. NRS-1564]|uniref:LytS/YhcK type 5TM receptor domain-containing protein n=1 Tax=Pseudalkalibacillus sp. NRS-1564 TaxID=3233900 RepID=UPI003D293CAC